MEYLLSLIRLFVALWNCSPAGSSLHGVFQARILKWVAISSYRGSSWPRDQTCVSCVFYIAGGFSTTESLGKPKDTGVGSLSLPQGIFQTQESNQGLLHCRWILYELSYQGNSKGSESCSVLSDSLWSHGLVLEARLLEWVAFSLLQQIFPI